MKHVVIVGGGISGLAAAHALRPHVRTGRMRVTLLEASDRLGGKVRSERCGGFVLEHGPDSFLTRKPELAELCAELGLALQAPLPQPRRTCVLRDGRLIDLPDGFTGLVPARALPLLRSQLLSTRARLRALCEPFVPRSRDDDLSVARFMSRRIGAGAYDALVAPLIAGVYGDGAVLSADATMPELRALERRYGSFARGFRAQRHADGAPADNAAPPANAPLVSLGGGLESVIDALRAALGDVTLSLGAAVRSIRRDGAGYTLQTDDRELSADALILALPANAAAPLAAGIDAPLADALRAIPHESVATVTLAFADTDVPVPLDAHGYLVPATEKRPVRAVTWTTSKLAGRAPADVALFRLFFASPGAVNDDHAALVAGARDELERTLGVRAAPLLERVVRWRDALPRYTLGHPQRVAAIDAALARLPGLELAGPSLHGSGLPDCVRGARAAASGALSHIDSA